MGHYRKTVRSLWTWLWGRYHVPQNVFLVHLMIFTLMCGTLVKHLNVGYEFAHRRDRRISSAPLYISLADATEVPVAGSIIPLEYTTNSDARIHARFISPVGIIWAAGIPVGVGHRLLSSAGKLPQEWCSGASCVSACSRPEGSKLTL